jgi:hypothetical protein
MNFITNLTIKIKKVLQDPRIIPLKLFQNPLLPDRTFLKLQYRYRTGEKLNFEKPILYNEKLQWLKLYDRKSEYTNMADKYEVRKYISQLIGDEYLIPIYGVWDTFDDIPFDTLPDEFVLKCTHDSGGIKICQNKEKFDTAKGRNFFKRKLGKNYYWRFREYVYKNIKPRIIAEKYMVDESGVQLKDYKIFCFNGEPKIIQVDIDRFTAHKRNLYSLQWEYLPLSLCYPTDPSIIIQRPIFLELMLDLARKLSAGKIHVRVDLYNIVNKIYFSELTFFHGSGYERFNPPEWNRTFGDLMTLPSI